ncbi:MAG TPA: ABC transporter substrate-binding protein [Alphaproteobacteria bacterium]
MSRTRLQVLCLAVAALIGASRLANAQTVAVAIGTTNTSSDVAFYIADKKGYFREQGIAATMTPFGSAAQMIAPLGAGQLDVGGGTVAAGLYNAAGRGISMKIVADKASIRPGYDFSTLMVRKDLVDSGRFKGFTDLKGFTVAVAARGTGSESAMNEALKRGGLKIDDVNLMFLGYPDHLLAYRGKAIEASITNEPTVTRAIQERLAVRVLQDDVVYPDQQTAVVLFSESFIKRRAVAEKFMVAYLRAVREYVDSLKDGKIAGPNAGEMIAILTQSTEIKDAEIYRKMTPNWVNPDGHVNLATLRNDYTFFKARGYIEKSVTAGVDEVVDETFVDAALRRLGPYQPKAAP